MITKKYQLTAGIFIILGGLLNLTRMIPAFAAVEQMPEFPLKDAQAIAAFVAPNYLGNLISHIMALAGFAFIIFGILFLIELYKKSSLPILLAFFKITSLGGFGLFFIAAVIDGIAVPQAVRAYVEMGEIAGPALQGIHHTAISFYSVALLLLFLAIGFNSNLILHTGTFKKWLGWTGLTLGHVVAVSYLLGAFGYFWDRPLGGLLIMSTNIYWIILGISVMRRKTTE